MSNPKLCWYGGCAQYGEVMGGYPACLMAEREPFLLSNETVCPYPDEREPVTYYAD